MYKDKLINGPVNIIRLEGKNENIKKVIYLFIYDYSHKDCKTKNSVKLKEYIEEKTKNDKNIVYDLFFKFKISKINNNSNKSKNYHENILTFYKNNKKLDTIKYSEVINYNNNIRTHIPNISGEIYSDIIFINETIVEAIVKQQYNEILNYLNLFIINVRFFMQSFILSHLKDVSRYDKKLFNFDPILNDKISMQDVVYKDLKNIDTFIKPFFEKLFFSYKYESVKNTLNKIINQSINIINTSINILIEKSKRLQDKKPGKDLLYEYEEIEYITFDIYTNISHLLYDFIMIRRILDKDYITNAIIYSPTIYTYSTIYYLIKYFGFKITNIERTKTDINILNKKIMKLKHYEILLNIIGNYNDPCIKMTDFPSNFL